MVDGVGRIDRDAAEEAAEEALADVFGQDVAAAVVESGEAFGAVVGKLMRGSDDPSDWVGLLAEVDPDDAAFIVNANNPAAFLASRIYT